MPARAKLPLLTHHHTYHSSSQTLTSPTRLMEVSGSAAAHNLGDSFSYGWLNQNQAPPSLDRLAADAAGLYSFGSSRSSFIDMDPGDLFSMRWTTNDFDFGLQGGGGGGPPAAQLVSASQIFRDGRLLPCEPGVTAAVQPPHGDGSATRPPTVDAAPGVSRPSSPLFHSAQSTPLSLSASSSATSKHGRQRPVARRGGSPWKVLLRYVRFLMPLYRKARALAPARRAQRRVAPAGSPSRGSTSSVEWCHGSADTAVHDAILYCKKSIGKDALPAMKEINR